MEMTYGFEIPLVAMSNVQVAIERDSIILCSTCSVDFGWVNIRHLNWFVSAPKFTKICCQMWEGL